MNKSPRDIFWNLKGMLDTYEPHSQWYEEDLTFRHLAGVLPYKQGEPTTEEIEKELNKFIPSSVPNLTALSQFDIRQPVFSRITSVSKPNQTYSA